MPLLLALAVLTPCSFMMRILTLSGVVAGQITRREKYRRGKSAREDIRHL